MRVVITGRPHDIASRRHLPEGLVDRRGDEDVGTRQPQRELVVPAPTAEEDTVHGQLPRDRVRVLALPLPGRSAPDQERHRGLEAWPRPGVGSHEERDALEAEVAPDEHEQRQRLAAATRERSQRLRLVADAPGNPRLVPALGVVDEPVAQEFETLVARERRALEAIRIDAVWDHVDQVARDAQETHGLGRLVGRNADDAPAAAGRRFEANGPVLSIAISAQIRPPQQLALRFRQSVVGRHLT